MNLNKVYSEFQKLLNQKCSEEELHQYIKNHSYLISDLGYGVKLIFSKPVFGSNFKADFALVGWGNYYCWTFIEIEKSTDKLFTQEGLLSQALNRAIKQINSWWIWLYDYGEYAKSEFFDLSGDKTAVIIIGRRDSMSKNEVKMLQLLNATQLSGKLKIVTYDALLDNIEQCSDKDLDSLNSKHEKMTRFNNTKEWDDYQSKIFKNNSR